MDLIGRYTNAVHYQDSLLPVAHFPTALARAVTTVLPVAAAGITITDQDSCTPLGASDHTAAAAERWLFTHGTGPGVIAVEDRAPVMATGTTLRRRWPLLHDALRRHTPYTAVLVLPLQVGHWAPPLGLLTLYLHQPAPGPTLAVPDAVLIAAALTTRLLDRAPSTPAPPPGAPGSTAEDLDFTQEALCSQDLAVDGTDQPDQTNEMTTWWQSPAARARYQVWVAVGMSMHTLHLDSHDALALLRARAISCDITLDALAADITSARTPLRTLDDPGLG